MRREHLAPRARVLALFPTARGIGFALVDHERRLLDWGTRGVRARDEGEKNAETMRRISDLIHTLEPTTIVLEDTRDRASRRHDRIRRLHALILVMAREENITVLRYRRDEVYLYFGVTTKHALAEVIASALPALRSRIPPKRKPWMSEDARQSLFDAAALGLMALRSDEDDTGAISTSTSDPLPPKE